ncbi:MAG: HAD family hydrolase [Verrucomicrobiaceae bacterium]|nr:HAD family hydrolase [Verrucomicrobiaceae bacterium]
MHRAIIFDFDGLLVDTETAIYESWKEVYCKHGQSLELETYKQCVGSDFGQFSPETELEKRTGKKFDWPTINGAREQIVREQLSTQNARPGVREFIQKASGKGIRLAVASSSSRAWVAGWLEKLDILKHFHSLRNRDDVERIKPHPDLFLAATEAVGVPPGESLVMEDSENGLRAAKAAGIPCVIVTNPVTTGGDFSGALLQADCFTADSIKKLIA